MRFIDQVRVLVRAGSGGNGAVAWRREKFVPMGGPAGGDGGRGGSVVFVGDSHLSTLLDLKFRQHFKAKSGKPGSNKRCNGKSGDDLHVRVPVGTVVVIEGVADESDARPPWFDSEPGLVVRDDGDEGGVENVVIGVSEGLEEISPEQVRTSIADQAREIRANSRGAKSKSKTSSRKPVRGEIMGDVVEDGQEIVVVRGGRGGRGNVHFLSSTNRAPDHAEPGGVGEALWLRLELKLLADVGIVGFPNVGKSTLISKISRARPKIGNYPFTTIVPQLGVVGLPDHRSMVVADIPGLIRGASQGKGLGHAFLHHLERTRVLLHLLAPDPSEDREPLADLDALEQELRTYGSMFDGRPRVVALNKIDTEEGRAQVEDTRRALRARGIPLFSISAHTGEGIPKLLEALWRRVAAKTS
jgi:GTP-binding protein